MALSILCSCGTKVEQKEGSTETRVNCPNCGAVIFMMGLSEEGDVPETYGVVGAEMFEGPAPEPPLKRESASDIARPNWFDRYREHAQTKKGDKGKALELILRAGTAATSDPFAATLYLAVTQPAAETTVADLVKVAASGHPVYSPVANMLLQHVGPDEVRASRETLKLLQESRDPQVQAVAIQCLQKIGPTPLIHVRDLIGLLGGQHAALSVWAVQCLALIGPPARKAIDPLFKALKTAEREQRLAIIDSLGAIGRDADRVVPLLTQALKNPKPEYRSRAALALARFGSAAAPAGGLLNELLKDGSPEVREASDRALKAINAPLTPPPASPDPSQVAGSRTEPLLVPCKCGKRLRVKPELAGRKVKCPACGDVVAVPLTTPSSAEKVCPVCLATVPTAAILCVHCGIDFRTGKPLSISRESPAVPAEKSAQT